MFETILRASAFRKHKSFKGRRLTVVDLEREGRCMMEAAEGENTATKMIKEDHIISVRYLHVVLNTSVVVFTHVPAGFHNY